VKIAVQKSGPHFLDKEWMAVQRVSGADYIHITYTDMFSGPPCPFFGSSIEYVRSTDGGASFSSPMVIDQVCGIPILQGSHVAVGNGSDIYVAWETYPNGMFGSGRQIKIRKSANGGLTFAPTVVVTNVTVVGNGSVVQGHFQDHFDFQGLVIDTTSGPNSGNVYITWQDGRNRNQTDPFNPFGVTVACPVGTPPVQGYCFGDILSTRSIDGGATWSAPIRVNDDPIALKVDHMFPAVEVDRNGQVFTVFYDRRRDSRNFLIDTFTAKSADAGQTWKNHRVTKNNFAAIHTQDSVIPFGLMEDYLGIAADRLKQGDGVIVSWGDDSLGNASVAVARLNGDEEDNE
jgi:hypothetical protein